MEESEHGSAVPGQVLLRVKKQRWLSNMTWTLRGPIFEAVRQLKNLSVDGQTICLIRCSYSASKIYLLLGFMC